MPDVIPMPTQGAKASAKLEAYEGIRGLAAVAVLLGHLIVAFWPPMYFPAQGIPADYPGWARWVANSPLRVLYDSQFAVSLFFILSGFVLSLAFFRKPGYEVVASAAARRYPRLMLPTLFSVVVAYLVAAGGGMHGAAAGALLDTHPLPKAWVSNFYNDPPVARVALRQTLWDTFFVNGANAYNANVWTMSVELPGSFLVYAFVAMFGTLRGRVVFYALGGVVLALSGKLFMLDFLAGVALADLYQTNEQARRKFRLPWPAAVGLALLAVYVVYRKAPAGTAPTYDLWGLTTLPKPGVYETVAGCLLIGATAFSHTLQRFFERGVFSFLGRISFSLYLLHLVVICSLGCYLYVALRQGAGVGHHGAAAVAFLASVAASVAASWVMYRLVDKPTIWLTRWGYETFFRKAAGPAAGAESAPRADGVAKAA